MAAISKTIALDQASVEARRAITDRKLIEKLEKQYGVTTAQEGNLHLRFEGPTECGVKSAWAALNVVLMKKRIEEEAARTAAMQPSRVDVAAVCRYIAKSKLKIAQEPERSARRKLELLLLLLCRMLLVEDFMAGLEA